MNQKTKFNSSELKGILINILISLLVFLLFLLIGSFVLMRFHHFERFYIPLVYLSMVFLSLSISLLSKRLHGRFIFYAMITSLAISMAHFSVNLIFSPFEFRFNHLFPNVVLLASTFIICVFLSKSKGNRRKQRNFPYKK